MTKRVIILALLLAPLSAWALTTANNRAAASGDYLPGADLSTQFGRMAGGEDYLPGGDSGGGGAVGSGGTDPNGSFLHLRRRLRR